MVKIGECSQKVLFQKKIVVIKNVEKVILFSTVSIKKSLIWLGI